MINQSEIKRRLKIADKILAANKVEHFDQAI